MTGQARFAPGQRWFSTAEPELGLATVLRAAGRHVELVFVASGEIRRYAVESAPLLRAAFGPGNQIVVDGTVLTVDSVQHRDGLEIYFCGERQVPEGELDAEQPVSHADTRLLAGRVDAPSRFALRVQTLARRAETLAHPGLGLLGARIDLIPHQLAIAQLAQGRTPVRLLLADEVGLGKTIEAGMIIAQRVAQGRADRVLILVPEALLHPWFVELYRRFNLPFALYDESRCEALAAAGVQNPFDDDQHIIAPIGWLASNESRQSELLEAGVDLLVVDEAHHLRWSPSESIPEYDLVAQLARATGDLLLLTATPEQLGPEGHFARLALLDPDRYQDLATFQREAESHGEVSRLVTKLESAALSATDRVVLESVLGDDPVDRSDLGAVVEALVDRHAVGRVMLRHRRAVVGGFPRRIPHVIALEPAAGMALDDDTAIESVRLQWLIEVLAANSPARSLVLVESADDVEALAQQLEEAGLGPVGRFHEDMSLQARDRQAAWFHEPTGPETLVASAVGAEGRNFQNASHLVLWHVPLDPDQIEQRIGRLDRIGQRGDVHVHAAAVTGTPAALRLRWLAEGVGVFQAPAADGAALLQTFAGRVAAMETAQDAGSVAALLTDTAQEHRRLADAIEAGRDRLLDHGLRGQPATLEQALERYDAAACTTGIAAILELFEHFGVHADELADRVWRLDPEYLTVDGFAAFANGPVSVTCSRELAQVRDDLVLLADDHPWVSDAMELLLGGETGNACAVVDPSMTGRSFMIEAIYVVEVVAARDLACARFLPPRPVAVAIDHRLAARASAIGEAGSGALERFTDDHALTDFEPLRRGLAGALPPMLERASQRARTLVDAEVAAARAAAAAFHRDAVDRLEALLGRNLAITREAIVALRDRAAEIDSALGAARPRLDALRLVVSPALAPPR